MCKIRKQKTGEVNGTDVYVTSEETFFWIPNRCYIRINVITEVLIKVTVVFDT
jgi:hypothetical protein